MRWNGGKGTFEHYGSELDKLMRDKLTFYQYKCVLVSRNPFSSPLYSTRLAFPFHLDFYLLFYYLFPLKFENMALPFHSSRHPPSFQAVLARTMSLYIHTVLLPYLVCLVSFPPLLIFFHLYSCSGQ